MVGMRLREEEECGRADHVGKEGRHGYKESILLGGGI